jgi:hypothetical protein
MAIKGMPQRGDNKKDQPKAVPIKVNPKDQKAAEEAAKRNIKQGGK